MDKASKVIRRSSVRLKAIGTGHSELNMVLCGLRDMRLASKNFIQSQSTASQDLLRWSIKTENRAIQDTFAQLIELSAMWEDVQKEFSEHLKEFRNQFQMIYEGERHVDQARGHLVSCEAQENYIKKDLKKASKKCNAEEVRQLEIKLAQAQRAKDLAQFEVVDKVQEHEAVKLIRIKEGLIKLSDSYIDLANKCNMIFDSHRDIAHQLPDVQDKCIHDLRYTGSMAAKQAVVRARERIQRYRRQSNTPGRHYVPPSPSDPPPPYSPTFSTDNSPYNPHINNALYPEHMNPFYENSADVLSSRSGPFTVNNQPRDMDLEGQRRNSRTPQPTYIGDRSLDITSSVSSPMSDASRTPGGNNSSALYEEDEELVGAIGGVHL